MIISWSDRIHTAFCSTLVFHHCLVCGFEGRALKCRQAGGDKMNWLSQSRGLNFFHTLSALEPLFIVIIDWHDGGFKQIIKKNLRVGRQSFCVEVTSSPCVCEVSFRFAPRNSQKLRMKLNCLSVSCCLLLSLYRPMMDWIIVQGVTLPSQDESEWQLGSWWTSNLKPSGSKSTSSL